MPSTPVQTVASVAGPRLFLGAVPVKARAQSTDFPYSGEPRAAHLTSNMHCAWMHTSFQGTARLGIRNRQSGELPNPQARGALEGSVHPRTVHVRCQIGWAELARVRKIRALAFTGTAPRKRRGPATLAAVCAGHYRTSRFWLRPCCHYHSHSQSGERKGCAIGKSSCCYMLCHSSQIMQPRKQKTYI